MQSTVRTHMTRRPAAGKRLAALLTCLLALAISGCDSFDFYGLLSGTGAHGAAGGPLEISPVSVVVTVDSSCTFTAIGGTPPYRFSVLSGAGTIDAGTGVYRAPTSPSTDTIEVSDAAGGTASAVAEAVAR